MAEEEKALGHPTFDEGASRDFWLRDESLVGTELLEGLVECDRVHHELQHRAPSREVMMAAAHAAVELCLAPCLRDFIEQAVSVAEDPRLAKAVLAQLRGAGRP